VVHRPAGTLSNVKGKRDAPSLPANVTCLHSTQMNRSEPDVVRYARLREQCDGLGVDVDRLPADDVQE
jgi:hypothetical protein